MGILKERPLVLRNIVAFLVLKVLAGLEIDEIGRASCRERV